MREAVLPQNGLLLTVNISGHSFVDGMSLNATLLAVPGEDVNSIRSSVTDATRLPIEYYPTRVAKMTTIPYKHQLLRFERCYLIYGWVSVWL